MVGGSRTTAWVVHFLIGTVLWGGLFAWLDPYLRRVFGDTLGREMAALNGPAALDLRVNLLKGDRLGAKIAQEGITGLRGAVGTPAQIREFLRRYEDCGVDQGAHGGVRHGPGPSRPIAWS